jgi:hypothetical protein
MSNQKEIRSETYQRSTRLKRLERWNNHMNTVSLLLFTLALCVIPVAYFSLEAGLEDQKVTVSSSDYELKGFVGYMQPLAN